MPKKSDGTVIFAPRFELESTYLADYFGLWAIHDSAMLRAVEKVQGIDLRAHIQQDTDGGSGRGGLSKTADGIATINIMGPTMKFVPSMAEGTSTARVRQQLKAAKRDSEVRGVMLVMDTPGGTSKGNEDLANEVAALAAVKPVFAFIEDMTASAGVATASMATKRFANNATAMYGAMGTYAVIQDMSGMAEKLGIKVHVIKAGEFKGAGTDGTEITEKQIDELQRVVNSVNEAYLGLIAKGLKRSVESVRSLADGRVILASDALSAGLIDGIQSFDTTYQELVRAVSKQNQSNVYRGGQKMEPATLAQLKATFPNSTAEWRETQIEAQATLSDAAISYATHVETQATAEREQHKKDLEAAKTAKPKSNLGHEPLTAGNVANNSDDPMQTGDPVADFDAAVRARLPKHRAASLTERQAAVAYVSRSQPKLHRDYILATNSANKRVLRLISEKYEGVAAQ